MPDGATSWTEEQTRQNFEAAKAMVVPGSPGASKLLRHLLARAAGGRSYFTAAASTGRRRATRTGRCSRRGSMAPPWLRTSHRPATRALHASCKPMLPATTST
ncbi:MAG: hypothetical protein WKG07_46610 [Hymenobacter sp.]